MKILVNIAELFCQAEVDRVSENNIDFQCSFKESTPFKPNKDELLRCFTTIPSRDSVEILCQFEHQEDSILDSVEDIDSFLSDLETKITFKDDNDSFSISITIHKGRVEQVASIYSLESIVSFWEEGGIVDSFKKIQELSSNTSVIRVYDLNTEFRTGCFLFTPFISENKLLTKIDREELHTKRDIVGHFSGSSQFDFIPEDFSFLESVNEPKSLIELFIRLKFVSSLIYLCDFTKFSNNNKIHLRLNGYRLFAKDLKDTDEFTGLASNEYFRIYDWVFSEGNLVDKIGLARNIISLHLEDNDLLKIEKNTLQSISSGYQIYLKDNVKQYIEIKNKLSEFIQNSSDKASEMVRNVGSYYKGSIWTMYSFFITVFLVEIISKTGTDKFITHQLFVLFLVFCVVTLIVMSFALKELDTEKKRLSQSYNSLIKRYEDLLLAEDLLKVLGDHEQHNEDMVFIASKRKSYRNLWLKSLGVIFLVITLFWYYDNTDSINKKVLEVKETVMALKLDFNKTNGSLDSK